MRASVGPAIVTQNVQHPFHIDREQVEARRMFLVYGDIEIGVFSSDGKISETFVLPELENYIG
jgi:hypothetical protein